jgi:Protein of unknown function (DUF3301)
MPALEIILVALFVALGWFWLDSLKAREAAVHAAREACESEGLLLLDDTVAIAGLKPVRDEEGRITLQRTYDFEYSDTGNDRHKGSVVLMGKRLILSNVAGHSMRAPKTLY